jgi:mannose-1-phosphate guanylyltransferase/mannose-1-phosphate guanylyltransferase/mannose-6-phosphate isomerase
MTTSGAAGHVVPVILSGGSGTRLWPVSRSGRPKQLIALTGDHTMLQATARRTRDSSRFAPPMVVANFAHAGQITQQLEEVGLAPAALILEPVARNTAPAIALAAHEALARDPDAVLLVMPSDHVVADDEAFAAAIDAALPAVAEQGWLATFGITPTGPETGYGYIKHGAPIAPGVDRALRFVEKPDRARAQAYLDEGGYSWNGGIFLLRADDYLAALDAHAPEIAAAVRAAMEGAVRDGPVVHPDRQAFAASPSDSIDYAVMEKADRVAVAPVSMGWSDVGSWDALHDIAAKDDGGNAVSGDVIAIGTQDCLLRSEGPLVAAIGVSGLSVIATDDAVLVMPRGQSQEVKRAVEKLNAVGHRTLHRPARVPSRWGHERHIVDGDGIKLCLIEVAPGTSSAVRTAEGMIELRLISGKGRVDHGGALGRTPLTLPSGATHCIVNEGERPLVVLETIVTEEPTHD